MNSLHKFQENFRGESFPVNFKAPVFVLDTEKLIFLKDRESFEKSEAKKLYEEILSNGLPLPFDEFWIETIEAEPRLLFFVKRQNEIIEIVMCFYSKIASCFATKTYHDVSTQTRDMGMFFNESLYENGHEASQSFLQNSFVLKELLLQLNTQGLVRKVEPAPEKLNKQRAIKQKPLLTDTIYIQPKYYYDKEGNEHDFNPAKPITLHWRRGHLRGVRYGKGKELLKMMFIKPCLVNYREGDEIPEHKTRVMSGTL